VTQSGLQAKIHYDGLRVDSEDEAFKEAVHDLLSSLEEAYAPVSFATF